MDGIACNCVSSGWLGEASLGRVLIVVRNQLGNVNLLHCEHSRGSWSFILPSEQTNWNKWWICEVSITGLGRYWINSKNSNDGVWFWPRWRTLIVGITKIATLFKDDKKKISNKKSKYIWIMYSISFSVDILAFKTHKK